MDFYSTHLEKSNFVFFTFLNYIEKIILSNYNLDVIFSLVPNCPSHYVGAKWFDAKLSIFLSWCQIACLPLVLNCPFLLSWCQIGQCQIIRVPNCLMPNCPVPTCLVPNCPTTEFTPCHMVKTESGISDGVLFSAAS